ncbi:hypothetical protein [Synechococcus phage BUCT-ZZ01]|nr:hypothetical protein [Synechococcus phage BUCT-ZZ01]
MIDIIVAFLLFALHLSPIYFVFLMLYASWNLIGLKSDIEIVEASIKKVGPNTSREDALQELKAAKMYADSRGW